jgi:hypothetical protein
MHDTYILFGWSTLLTIIGILFMFILKGLKDDVKKLFDLSEKTSLRCEEIMQNNNNMYVRRDDYIRFQDNIMESINRIEGKIDTIQIETIRGGK